MPPPNVLILLVDSLSRAAFHRQFPLTLRLLQQMHLHAEVDCADT